MSNDSGTINVTAGNNNIIGQYKDESGNTVTSENGINVTAGTVNITTENGTNKIFAGAHGILTDGNNAVAKLVGNTHEILVNGNQDAVGDRGAYGIHAQNNSFVIAPESQTYKTFTINVTGANGADLPKGKGSATGIKADTSSQISLFGETLNINANGSNAKGIDIDNDSAIHLSNTGDIYINTIGQDSSYGIYSQNASLDLNAENLTIISTSGEESAIGIYNYPATGENYVNIDTRQAINVSTMSGEASYGIQVSGVGSDIHSGTDINVNVLGGDGEISAYNTSGINSKLTAEGNITLSMKSVNGIDGGWTKAGVFCK